MQSTFMPACLLLPVAVLLAVVGVVLLRQGLRPRRQGQTPHCRKCDYNLTGLTGEKCPECGQHLGPDSIVYGEGHRSRGRAVAGALCLVPAVLTVVLLMPQVNWYQFRPTNWLMADLKSTSPVVFNRAWNELERRDRAGSLSRSQRGRLIDLCLQEQAAPKTRSLTSEMVDYLGDKCLAGELSPAQRATFIRQIMKVSLEIRPRAVAGHDVAYRVREENRGPSQAFWVRCRLSDISLDGKVIRQGGSGSATSSGVGAGGSTGSTVKVKRPGRHTIGVTASAQLYAGPFGDEGRSQLIGEQSWPLEGEVEVLATQPADFVKALRRPDLISELQACIEPKEFRLTSDGGLRLEGKLAVKQTPTPIAFKIYARIDGREYHLSSISQVRGGSTQYHVAHRWSAGVKNAPAPFVSCDVILRGSEDVARRTVELFEFWDGELVYENVPVEWESPATQDSRPAEARRQETPPRLSDAVGAESHDEPHADIQATRSTQPQPEGH